MINEERVIKNVTALRELLSKDNILANDIDNVAAVIAAIMEYCALHDNNCEGCIFNRHDAIGCCFNPRYSNPIPENWDFKTK